MKKFTKKYKNHAASPQLVKNSIVKAKTVVGLEALVRFCLRHIWGRGHLLRKVLLPAAKVSYLER